MLRTRLALVLITPMCLALPTRASDWYVDALNGSDANNGTTQATAWKTLTHALATIPTALVAHTVHVAPGTYNAALGESYPLEMRPGLRLSGDQGSSFTFLESAGATLLAFRSIAATTGYDFDATSGADGLTLRYSAVGLDMSTNWNHVSPSFQDVVIHGMSGDAVSIVSFGFTPGIAHPRLSNVRVAGCNRGFLIEASGSTTSSFGNAVLDLADSVVASCATDGLLVSAGQGTAQANLQRCRVSSNLGTGVRCSTGSFMQAGLTASATLIARNSGSGVGGVGGANSHGEYHLSDCTLANNGQSGFSTMTGTGVTQTTTLRNCILYGNLDDFTNGAGGSVTAGYCDSGDGDLLAQPHCIAANPLFVDPANGDFRLQFGSPCVESGDPASTGALDILWHARPIDGDLDTLGEVDMGAFEFETLHFRGTPRPGAWMLFECWGATGSTTSVGFSMQAPTPAQNTPFGNFNLVPGSIVQLGSVPALPGPPHMMVRRLPNNPWLIGKTLTYQGLTGSAAAPQGQAYTNATSFVVGP